VGDALGIGLKGRKPHSPPFTQRAVGFRDMQGRAPDVAKGQVSEVTQLAAALAQGLIALESYNPQDMLRRYRVWQSNNANPSPWIKSALAAQGEFAGRNTWLRDGRRTADAGILGRAVPLAVFFAKDRSRAIRAALEDANLTHFHPRSQLSCVAWVGMLIAVFTHAEADVPVERVLEGAEESLVEGAAILLKSQSEFTLDVQQALTAVRENLLLAQQADPQLYGPELHLFRHAGWVDIPLRLALFELFQKRSFADALEDVVNRGGDAELNGGITGSLLGAVQGEDAIPETWRSNVLGALFNKPGPLRDSYHPKKLLELADAKPRPEGTALKEEPRPFR
jgi:ADP-ribosylglycohydrolase